MQRDVARQPQVLADLIGRRESFVRLGRDLLRPSDRGRLFVCGCGDGYFAAEAARGFAEALGLDWRPIGALDLVLCAGRLTVGDRVVAISMSGSVDRTVEAAQAAKARRVPVLALVNGQGGRLAESAGARIFLELPELAPFLCGTASYTATLAALMMLAAGAGEAAGAVSGLAPAVEAQTLALAASERVLPAFCATVPTGVRVLSAGPQIGTAYYGAAKFVELTRIPAWSGDVEEFAHSQYWAIPTDDLVIVVATDPMLARYANETCDSLGQLGVATLAIDTVESPVPRAAARVTLPAVDPAVSPLAAAIPLQLLAYRLAERSGLDPNTRAHLKNDATRFRVSRLLTRRSLVDTGR